jgi:hypothetical protein
MEDMANEWNNFTIITFTIPQSTLSDDVINQLIVN